MTPHQIKNCQKLSRFLRVLPPEKFDIMQIVTKAENGCGTVCCALGWLPVVFPKQVVWKADDRWDSCIAIGAPDDKTPWGAGSAYRLCGPLLGVTQEQTMELFYDLSVHHPSVIADRLDEIVKNNHFLAPA